MKLGRGSVLGAKRLPSDDNGNGWFEILPPPDPANSVTGSTHFDWAIVGAGVSGLTTARELALALPDATIALVDAQRVGYGPSGRNAGIIVTHHIHAPLKNISTTRKKIALSTAGTRYLRKIVRSHRISCDWNDWGRTYVAYNDTSEQQLNEMLALYARLGLRPEEVSAEVLRSQTGIEIYRRGLHFDDSALVNPAAMCRGICAALSDNVSVFENAPVHTIEIGPPHRLGFARGEILAGSIIFATNTFTAMFGVNKRTVPIAVFASLTEPIEIEGLPSGQQGEYGVMEVLDTGATVRKTRDNRLFIRGGYYTYCNERHVTLRDLKIAEQLHNADLEKRYPYLKGIRLTYTWAGVVGFSRNDAHLFGKLGEGIYANVPFDTSPVSRGSLAGKLLVDDILGRESELLQIQKSLPKPAWLPPEPLLGAFVRRKIEKMIKEAGIVVSQ